MSSNLIYPTIKIQGLTVTIVSLACPSMLFQIAWFLLHCNQWTVFVIWKSWSIKVPSALHQSTVYWFIGRVTCCIHSCHQVNLRFSDRKFRFDDSTWTLFSSCTLIQSKRIFVSSTLLIIFISALSWVVIRLKPFI